jgi:hypothetical protein
MKPTRPFGLSLTKAVLLLLAIYLAVAIDVVTGLNLNLFGYGREPLLFAVGAVVVASSLYAWGRPALGMIGLVFCCAWLVFYPAKNGFDVVLSPLLVIGFAMWLWTKRKRKQ